MKHSRRPICVHRSAVRRARQGRFITGAVRSCRSAFVRPCNAVCRRFAARRRGFAERKDVFAVCRDFRRFRKVVLRALAPARPVRRALFPVRSAPDTGLRHTAGPAGERTAVGTARSAFVLACAGGACGYAVIGCATPTAGAVCAGCRFGARARKDVFIGRGAAGKSQKRQPARDGRRHFCRRPQRRFCARFGRLRLLAGKHVCVPTTLSAADAESRQKSFSARAGAAAGRLRAVDRGLRNSSAGGGHGMRRVMKKYGLSSRAVRFFPIVRRAVSPGLHNITNEMKNRTILRLPFDRLGGGLRV